MMPAIVIIRLLTLYGVMLSFFTILSLDKILSLPIQVSCLRC